MSKTIKELREYILTNTSGKCNCLTKTPDINYHDEKCEYKILMNIYDSLTEIQHQLESITKSQYGLQSIIEDYEFDSKEYYEETSMYYQKLVNRFQHIARKVNNNAET